MQLKKVKKGRFYTTTNGEIIEVLQVGGTFPPTVRGRVLVSMRRGDFNFDAKHIAAECEKPPAPPASRTP